MSAVPSSLPFADNLPFEPDAVVTAHEATLKLVSRLNLAQLELGWMYPYPRGWCSVMSYTLLHVFDQRGFGPWRIVNGQDTLGNRHDWLEFMRDGDVLFSVDATQHQFSKLGSGPFIGHGCCPAKARFHIDVRTATLERMPTGWAKRAEIVVADEVTTALAQDS
ncbi:hypothetical protein SRABI98_00962 [Microbacterium sp. Bi98]|uniref:hypothetical protein n=1 Tax=Microbacterium sp. Bi98 TaxID=2821116 RepID=UPI001DBFA119|nr:hypothetical protein [Microbacterium sp. Bi98]CAH0158468.1 hypothetical protein SRABI98_00962 [Microbacterium sp. Bi98]